MCLFLDYNRPPSITSEPIQVFKVLLKREGIYISPYYEKEYKVGMVAHSSLRVLHNELVDCHVVREGIHSFTTYDAAFAFMNSLLDGSGVGLTGIQGAVILGGSIPPDTEYYCDDSSHEIASTTMTVGNVILEYSTPVSVTI